MLGISLKSFAIFNVKSFSKIYLKELNERFSINYDLIEL